MKPLEALFDRDGRLHDRILEAYAARELDEASADAVAEHLATHLPDRRRWEALREHSTAFRPAPPRFARRSTRSRRFVVLSAVTLAVAASVVLAFRGADPEGWRVKGEGGTLVLEVWAERSGGDVRLRSGDVVHPGDRVGFRAVLPDGFLLVAGVDATHEPYPAVASEGRAIWVDSAREPLDLGAAIRFDATPGPERLVAVHCPEAFGFADIADVLRQASRAASGDRLPALRPGCGQDELLLTKGAPR